MCHSNVRIAFGQYVAGILNSQDLRPADADEFYAMNELNKRT